VVNCQHEAPIPRHEPAKARDFVFTRARALIAAK
jgi:hypothetical protein